MYVRNAFNRLRRLLPSTSVLALMILMGCYPDQPEFVEEYDVVYTNYSPDFNFNDSYTFSLPDSVLLLDDRRGPDDPPEFIDAKFGDVILENIQQNLESKGWSLVDEAADPQIVILASAFDTQFLYFYNPGYWCWYYPWSDRYSVRYPSSCFY